MNDLIICPRCKNKVIRTLDEWGHTPYHIHCIKCNINIGAHNWKEADKIFLLIEPDTWIEYFNNKVQDSNRIEMIGREI